MNLQMIDLRTVTTTARLTQAEKMEAQMRHLAAMNDSQLAEKKARNARLGLTPRVHIGRSWIPPSVARQFHRIDWLRGAA
jgi:hypothetical protein